MSIDYKTQKLKLVFVDVVSFTAEHRTVEDMFAIIQTMYSIVKENLSHLKLTRSVIVIPTGDGMCIAIKKTVPYDIHLQLAQLILSGVVEHSGKTSSYAQQYHIRVAVNENDDLVFKDYNGRSNVAGVGINTSARIMAAAKNGGIVVSDVVYGNTHNRREYKGRYTKTVVSDKHGVTHVCYLLDVQQPVGKLINTVETDLKKGELLDWYDLNSLMKGMRVFHNVHGFGIITGRSARGILGRRKVIVSVQYKGVSFIHDFSPGQQELFAARKIHK